MIETAVITRTKDRPKFLERALVSVASQSRGNLVHVVVNDGGDPSQVDEIVDKARTNTDNEIAVFHRGTASGAPDTIFNESIDRVNSKYVAIHDDDDTWHTDFLEYAITAMEQNNTQGAVVRTDRVYEKYKNGSIEIAKTKAYLPTMKTNPSLYRQCIENQLTPISFLYTRKAYKKIGRYDSSLPVAGDWEFGIRFLSAYEVEFVDPGYPLAFYHKRLNRKDNSYSTYNHRKYATLIANKYLRKEVAAGTLGLGYIISKSKHEIDSKYRLIKKIIPQSVVKKIRKR